MPEPAIQVSGLTKSYGDVHALCGVDIIINKGEFFGLNLIPENITSFDHHIAELYEEPS